MLFRYRHIKATLRHRGIVKHTRSRVYIMQIDFIDWLPDSPREYRLVARFTGSIPSFTGMPVLQFIFATQFQGNNVVLGK